MSKLNYRTMANDRIFMVDMMSGILRGLEKTNSRRITPARRKSFQTAAWRVVDQQAPKKAETASPLDVQVTVPETMFEVSIPKELLDGNIHNEMMLIGIPQNETDALNSILPDAAIPESKCKETVEKVLCHLYKVGTGKELDISKVTTVPYCRLEKGWCCQCCSEVEELVHRCSKCGRGFCYDHLLDHDGCSESESNTQTVITKDKKIQSKPRQKKQPAKTISNRRTEAWC